MKYFLAIFKNVVFLIFLFCVVSGNCIAEENTPPVISLTAVKQDTVISGTSYNNIIFTAVATDSDGSIAKVDFYSGQVLVGSSTTSPFTFKWIKVPTGTFNLTARAIDNEGSVTVSNNVLVAVFNNKLPEVSIMAPMNNQVFYEALQINIRVKATDSDGTIKRVEIYKNDVLVRSTDHGYDNIYEHNLMGSEPGIFVITAKAIDNFDAVTVSSPVTIDIRPNKAPVVNMISPANDSYFYEPADIEFEIDAMDEDGSINRINVVNLSAELYDNRIIAQLQSPPYKFTWKNVKAGNYQIRFIVVDDKERSTWKEINITVVEPQVPYKGVPWPIPGRIEAENYDMGGEGVGFHELDGFGLTNYYRGDRVDVEQNNDGYHVAYILKGEWLVYTVNVLNTGTYDFKINASNFALQSPGQKFMHIEINDIDVTGPVLIPDTEGWYSFQTVDVPGIFLAEGLQIMKVVFDSDEMNLDYVEFIPSDVVTGLPNRSSDNSVNIYPNPAADFFNLEVNEDISSLSVLNLLGQEVYVETDLTRGGEITIGDELDRGTYVLNVLYTSGKRESVRLIKVR